MQLKTIWLKINNFLLMWEQMGLKEQFVFVKEKLEHFDFTIIGILRYCYFLNWEWSFPHPLKSLWGAK